jgi:hypothetical protein
LSTDSKTAIAEYQQLSALMPPGTLVNFEVSVSRVVDFSAGYTPDAWDPLWNDFYDDWRNLWFDKKIKPPSWVLVIWPWPQVPKEFYSDQASRKQV